MKTIFRTTMLMLIMTTIFSCKKNDGAIEDNTTSDSTETPVDSVGPYSDSTTVNGAGTTGATGEGSTGSGSEGTVQKGNTTVKTDSVSNGKGRR